MTRAKRIARIKALQAERDAAELRALKASRAVAREIGLLHGIEPGTLVRAVRRGRVRGIATMRRTQDTDQVYRVKHITAYSHDPETLPAILGQRRKHDGTFETRTVTVINWEIVT